MCDICRVTRRSPIWNANRAKFCLWRHDEEFRILVTQRRFLGVWLHTCCTWRHLHSPLPQTPLGILRVIRTSAGCALTSRTMSRPHPGIWHALLLQHGGCRWGFFSFVPGPVGNFWVRRVFCVGEISLSSR